MKEEEERLATADFRALFGAEAEAFHDPYLHQPTFTSVKTELDTKNLSCKADASSLPIPPAKSSTTSAEDKITADIDTKMIDIDGQLTSEITSGQSTSGYSFRRCRRLSGKEEHCYEPPTRTTLVLSIPLNKFESHITPYVGFEESRRSTSFGIRSLKYISSISWSIQSPSTLQEDDRIRLPRSMYPLFLNCPSNTDLTIQDHIENVICSNTVMVREAESAMKTAWENGDWETADRIWREHVVKSITTAFNTTDEKKVLSPCENRWSVKTIQPPGRSSQNNLRRASRSQKTVADEPDDG